MYIAFKWLTGLAMAMWVAVCCVDTYTKSPILTKDQSFANLTVVGVKSKTHPRLTNYKQINDEQPSVAMVHCYMFTAGALAVSIFNKKTEILLYAKHKVAKLDLNKTFKKIKYKVTRMLAVLGLQMLHCSCILRYYMKMITYKRVRRFFRLLINARSEGQEKLHTILLNKLREVGEERKNLGQLLIAAIHENKNIRMQYQLESMAKTRLLRHIDDTHKQIKENRSRYVSFQHLYLVTHQENVFLKARLRKLQKDKEEAEKNLLSLINEIYRSKNQELKNYCSRFIVQTKENLLNSDVSAEIRKFLRSQPDNRGEANKILPDESGMRITEILNEDDGLVPLVSDAPRLKGLPGEYVWTVKDKDGIIEKLYEYDYETDLDNGDTISRIRQYSVYCDEECLLDYTKVFGKSYNIPRKHVAYGDPGVTYTYSGVTIPALPWPEPVLALRELLVKLKGILYNFVLVNRYKNGRDHIGPHRDNEPELDSDYPIASISLGQERDFVLKHKDSRKSEHGKALIPPVKILLENGSVLMMNPPTNEFWYHSIPLRKNIPGPRINLTFRKMRV
ncbi:uncharacterized protein LOC128683887 isoform X2 [Plodia interpunctella]|uniref:uncharacterized protein LOC128683887 isoform X2 n=1 Tax=Plodia interpunctella TaxID=58824 RepID=UPI002368A753|nr:uncharacterized protein LOC128683887 isoform X2 [Plodia interpunctella]